MRVRLYTDYYGRTEPSLAYVNVPASARASGFLRALRTSSRTSPDAITASVGLPAWRPLHSVFPCATSGRLPLGATPLDTPLAACLPKSNHIPNSASHAQIPPSPPAHSHPVVRQHQTARAVGIVHMFLPRSEHTDCQVPRHAAARARLCECAGQRPGPLVARVATRFGPASCSQSQHLTPLRTPRAGPGLDPGDVQNQEISIIKTMQKRTRAFHAKESHNLSSNIARSASV